MREAITLVIQLDIQNIIIESDTQLVINSINGRICIPKDINNLVKGNIILSFSLETLNLTTIQGY